MFAKLESGMREVETALTELDPNSLIGTQPATGLELIGRHERAVAAARAALTARASEMNFWQRQGYRSFEEWYAANFGTSYGHARRKTRTAKNLAGNDRTAQALADGDISETEADVVSDAAAKNPDAEEDLLDTAKNKGKSHDDLKRQAADAKTAAETDQQRAARLRKGRTARWGIDREGFWWLHGKFQPEIGAEIKAHLTAEVERIFNEARRNGNREARDRYCADAIANLITGTQPEPGQPDPAEPAATTPDNANEGPGAPTAADTGPDSGSDTPIPADPEADQLDLGLDNDPEPAGPNPRNGHTPTPYPTDDQTPTRPERAGVPKELILDINIETFRRGCVNPGETSTIRGVGPVPVEVALAWSADAFIKAVIRDGVDIKKVVHYGRHIPTEVRTALGVIDQHTCEVPRCSNPRIEYDHDHRHTDGGGCSTTNLRALCAFHHRQRTHDGYELVGEPGDRQWLDPHGQVLFADNPEHLTGGPVRAP